MNLRVFANSRNSKKKLLPFPIYSRIIEFSICRYYDYSQIWWVANNNRFFSNLEFFDYSQVIAGSNLECRLTDLDGNQVIVKTLRQEGAKRSRFLNSNWIYPSRVSSEQRTALANTNKIGAYIHLFGIVRKQGATRVAEISHLNCDRVVSLSCRDVQRISE